MNGVARPTSLPRLGQPLSWPWLVTGLALVFALSVGAVLTTPPGARISVWWPAAGLSAALFLLEDRRRWPRVTVLLVVVTGLANLAAGREPAVSAVFGVANSAEALTIAWLLTGGGRRRYLLDALSDIRRLVLASMAGAGVLAVSGAVAVTGLQDGDFWATLRSAFTSHAASVLVIIPLVVLGLAPRSRQVPRPRSWRLPGVSALEAVAQALTLVAMVAFVFVDQDRQPLAFLPFAAYAWGALRLTPLAACSQVAAGWAAVALLSSEGQGPFGGLAADGREAQLVGSMLQAFVGVLALVTLVLAISNQEHRAALGSATRERDFTQALVNTTEALLLVLAPDLTVTRVNAAAVRSSGRPVADLLGRPPWETVLLPRDERQVRALATRPGPRPAPVELAWVPAAGSPRSVAWSASRLVGSAGGAVLMTGIDVTRGRQSERLIRAVFDATTGTAIVGVSLTGVVLAVNAGAGRLLGLTPEDVGRTAVQPMLDPEEIAVRARELGVEPDVGALMAAATADGRPQRRDWTWTRRDGRSLVISIVLTFVYGADGTPFGYVGVGDDVTDARRAEQALRDALEHEREAVERLHELDRMKSSFVGSVSHELRTPLTSMLGFLHLLTSARGDPLTERQQHLLSRIDRNGRRLLAMVEDLLVLTRIEAGALRIGDEPVDLREVVDSALELIEELLEERDLRLVRPETGRPRRTVGDAAQLERVVVNLVSNAVKFTPDGGEVRVELDTVGEQVVLRVADTGMGMAPEDVPEVFTPFFRSTTATQAQIQGTGLGLAIVATVVDAHQGTVSCRSELGKGTTMEVRLPVEPSTPRPESRPAGEAGDGERSGREVAPSGPDQPVAASDSNASTRSSSRSGRNGLTT